MMFTAKEREARLAWLNQLRDYRIRRVEQLEHEHRVKMAAAKGRIQQLEDMIAEVASIDHIDALPDDMDLAPNDTDTFKE
jgi:hypothetical protein